MLHERVPLFFEVARSFTGVAAQPGPYMKCICSTRLRIVT